MALLDWFVVCRHIIRLGSVVAAATITLMMVTMWFGMCVTVAIIVDIILTLLLAANRSYAMVTVAVPFVVAAAAMAFLWFWLLWATQFFGNGRTVDNAPTVLEIVANQTAIFGRFGKHVTDGRWR